MIDYVRRLAGPYTQVGQKTFPFSFKIFETKDIYVAFIESESAAWRFSDANESAYERTAFIYRFCDSLHADDAAYEFQPLPA